MNYLGHLYFSNNDIELMYANLFGDFIKGTQLEYLNPKVRAGVYLHRQIDSFMDQHPAVKEVTHRIAVDLPKVSGIAVDLYFDHFLVKNWNSLHNEQLDVFLEGFYTYQYNEDLYPNAAYHRMISNLKKYRWIAEYKNAYAIEKASNSIAHRLSFPNTLMDSREVLIQHYDFIEEQFWFYMEEAQNYFSDYMTENFSR